MKHVLWLFLLAFFAALIVASSPAAAEQPSAPPDTNAMTYAEWCQHMDQLTQDLRIATRDFWIRGTMDITVELVGTVILFRSLWGWQETVSGLLILAGAVDFFFYTLPSAQKAILEYQMWKEAGASHMWLYPCTASTGDR